MDTSAVLDIGYSALVLAAKLAAPLLITALVVGFTVSLFQSVTQIQEVTLSFVPKAVGGRPGAVDRRALDDSGIGRVHQRALRAHPWPLGGLT